MPDLSAGRPVEILLIEDNPGDIRLTQEALRTARRPNRIRVAEDGVAAMAILRREGNYAHTPLPDLILLDLNLPRKDGREVLREIKADPVLRRIPVIILTTSQSQPDVTMAYDLHANCYITKPVDFARFQAAIKAIETFRLSTVRLPLDAEQSEPLARLLL